MLLHHCVVVFFWSSGITDCIWFLVLKSSTQALGGISGVVSFNTDWWTLNSFHKTEAAIFPMHAILTKDMDIPFFLILVIFTIKQLKKEGCCVTWTWLQLYLPSPNDPWTDKASCQTDVVFGFLPVWDKLTIGLHGVLSASMVLQSSSQDNWDQETTIAIGCFICWAVTKQEWPVNVKRRYAWSDWNKWDARYFLRLCLIILEDILAIRLTNLCYPLSDLYIVYLYC